MYRVESFFDFLEYANRFISQMYFTFFTLLSRRHIYTWPRKRVARWVVTWPAAYINRKQNGARIRWYMPYRVPITDSLYLQAQLEINIPWLAIALIRLAVARGPQGWWPVTAGEKCRAPLNGKFVNTQKCSGVARNLRQGVCKVVLLSPPFPSLSILSSPPPSFPLEVGPFKYR